MITEKQFFNKIEEWIQGDISSWNKVTHLAYFCYKYQFCNHNNPEQVPFKLVRSNKGVELSKGSSDFNKLFKLFAPENYSDLEQTQKIKIRTEVNLKIKNYINWLFDYKFRHTSKSVDSTGLILTQHLINDFERMYAQHLKKQNSKIKMDQLLFWCKKECEQIFELHQLENPEDLQIIKKYIEIYKQKEDSLEAKVINKAIEIGLLKNELP